MMVSVFDLTPDMSIRVIEEAIRCHYQNSCMQIDDYLYAKYVLQHINTVEDALAFADNLDLQSKHHRCPRAETIRVWLKSPFWREKPERIRIVIAAQRRTCSMNYHPYSYQYRD